jgi:starch synthase
VNALAAALHKLCANPALRAELGGRGRARAVAHFTHESVAAATVKVYREMMGG